MKKKAIKIIDILKAQYPDALCALHYKKDYELMIAVRLSAQCTDARVNLITPALFAAYPTLEAMANAKIEDVEDYVRTCGFYHQKAKDIVLACQMLIRDYGGKVPDTMDALLRLPGVGRKTANVVLGDYFGVPGLPVDTHVKRITNLLGVVKSDDPVAIEEILCSALPPERWAQFSHLLIMHGRKQCVARRADCANCVIAQYCGNRKKNS